MDNKSLLWPILRTFGCAVLGFVLGFQWSAYAEGLAYPWIASFEVLFKFKLAEGSSLHEFFNMLILMATIYFLFSFFYFLTKVFEFIVEKIRK